MESTATGRQTKTKRSGCVMSVSVIERNLRKGNYAKRIKTNSAVFMAGVLEHLCVEVLELAGNAAIQNNRVRITPRHIMMAVQYDEELKELLKDVQFPEAGVLPFIDPSLLKTKSGGARESEEL